MMWFMKNIWLLSVVLPLSAATSLKGNSKSDSRKLQASTNCSALIQNSDFIDGSKTGWSAYAEDGILAIFPQSHSDEQGGKSLLHVERNSVHSGPQHELDPACFIKDQYLEVEAYMKLLEGASEEGSGTGYWCDKLMTGDGIYTDDRVCPLITLRYLTPDGKYHWIHGGDKLNKSWDENGWNKFSAEIFISDELASAKEIVLYFERLAQGVDLVLSEVQASTVEFEGNLADDLNLSFDQFDASNVTVQQNCSHMILNGDFEAGDTRGWEPRLGGKLYLKEGGFGFDGSALLHTGRRTFVMGPKHALLPKCLVEGKKYRFESQIKLLDENGEGFACDKSLRWQDDNACPLLTVEYTTTEGEKKWIWFENTVENPWVANDFNWFSLEIEVSSELKKAKEASFYFERVRAGVSMVLDNVELNRDCTELIPNGHPESGSTEGWISSNGMGWIAIQNRTEEQNGDIYFIHHGRTSHEHGPRQNFDTNCLVAGRKYEINMHVKMQKEDGTEWLCDRYASWDQEKTCPMASFGLLGEEYNNGLKVINMKNTFPTQWVSGFNDYRGVVYVTEHLAKADYAFFYLRGPPPGIDVLFTNVTMSVVNEDITCDELIRNGNVSMGVENFYVENDGLLRLYEESDPDNTAIEHYNRESKSSAIKVHLHPPCMVEGTHYVFKGVFKLYNQDGTPYWCNKESQFGSNDFCVFASLYINDDTGTTHPVHMPNKSPEPWNTTDWNIYRADFIIDIDLAKAQAVTLLIRGPKEGISVVADDLRIEKYVPPLSDCSNLIKNGGVDDLDDTAWIPKNGKMKLHVEGAFGTETGIQLYDRTSIYDGVDQYLDSSCLIEGKQYVLTGFFKLLNENRMPFECDKNAAFGTSNFCIIATLIYNVAGSDRKYNMRDISPTKFEGGQWNYFYNTFTVSAGMSISKDMKLMIRGPRSGVIILMDEINLKEYTPPPPSCQRLITNSEANFQSLQGWKSFNGGYFAFEDSVWPNTVSFKYTGRGAVNSGPKQVLDISCFQNIGDVYEINALFGLLDEFDQPYACSKSVPWKDPMHCVMMTFEVQKQDGTIKRFHHSNLYGGEWIAGEPNVFRAKRSVVEDMIGAKSINFFFQGPRPGTSMIFDHVSMNLIESAS